MSTIAYRDGTMAADSRAYAGHTLPIGTKLKIRQLKNGGMIGVSTRCPGLSEQIMAWADGDDFEPENMDFTALQVDAKGQVFYYNGGLTPSGP